MVCLKREVKAIAQTDLKRCTTKVPTYTSNQCLPVVIQLTVENIEKCWRGAVVAMRK
jgi:hypothetical protein